MAADIRWNKAFVLGIVGGMGPLASAEFLKTIYEHSQCEREQASAKVVMHSDPSFPDRTEALLAGADAVVLEKLIEALECLRRLNISRIVICCVTIHHLLPRLPDDLREPIWSLPDLIFRQVSLSRERHLLLCSSGSRKLGVFRNHAQWPALKDQFILPDEDDQTLVHQLIHRLKGGYEPRRLICPLESLLAKYKANSFIAGCTEIHLLAKHYETENGSRREYGCVDPLTVIAKEVAQATKENL
ncbi:MAG TPA: aspartate/glutamate racemase family protein [Anaerolineales bacterium]|nr:aspartate/glutamate racemase family protein [Anaerolineales bacterium]